MSDIERKIVLSKAELRQALGELGAFELAGKFCLLAPALENEIVDDIFKTIKAEGFVWTSYLHTWIDG